MVVLMLGPVAIRKSIAEVDILIVLNSLPVAVRKLNTDVDTVSAKSRLA